MQFWNGGIRINLQVFNMKNLYRLFCKIHSNSLFSFIRFLEYVMFVVTYILMTCTQMDRQKINKNTKSFEKNKTCIFKTPILKTKSLSYVQSSSTFAFSQQNVFSRPFENYGNDIKLKNFFLCNALLQKFFDLYNGVCFLNNNNCGERHLAMDLLTTQQRISFASQ